MNKQGPITIFTDGAASGNPGPGGYGVVLLHGDLRKELSEGFAHTTNNRMELLAVIKGLEAIRWENAEVKIYTDSRYVSEAINRGWLFQWEKMSFKKKKNEDLWRKFLIVYRKHKVKIFWIKGHSDNIENERCDKLAVDASRQPELKQDEGYFKSDTND